MLSSTLLSPVAVPLLRRATSGLSSLFITKRVLHLRDIFDQLVLCDAALDELMKDSSIT